MSIASLNRMLPPGPLADVTEVRHESVHTVEAAGGYQRVPQVEPVVQPGGKISHPRVNAGVHERSSMAGRCLAALFVAVHQDRHPPPLRVLRPRWVPLRDARDRHRGQAKLVSGERVRLALHQPQVMALDLLRRREQATVTATSRERLRMAARPVPDDRLQPPRVVTDRDREPPAIPPDTQPLQRRNAPPPGAPQPRLHRRQVSPPPRERRMVRQRVNGHGGGERRPRRAAALDPQPAPAQQRRLEGVVGVVEQGAGAKGECLEHLLDTADPDRRADEPMRVPAPAIRDAARSEVGDHAGARDETPAGAPPEELDAAQRQQDDLAQTDQFPNLAPAAAASVPGCRTRIVSNRSSRRGVAPRLMVAHITVSPNRPGWSDVDGITAYFNRPSSQASSDFVVDAQGHCNYIVPINEKPWTPAAANPVSVSWEIINTGREGRLMEPRGYRAIGRQMARVGKLLRIPIRRGKVSGCTVIRSGIVQHKDFGACGGGHVDISPYDLQPITDAARRAAKPPCRARCQRRRGHAELHQHLERLECRRRAARARHPQACQRVNARNRALHKQGM